MYQKMVGENVYIRIKKSPPVC